MQVFLALALIGSKWSASCSCRLTPCERAPSTHWIGGWADPRAALDDRDKYKPFILAGLLVSDEILPVLL
jgi:hypothetical protein